MAPSWQAVKETFFSLAALSPSERAERLEQIREEQPRIWQDVVRLLKQHDQPDGLLDSRALEKERARLAMFREGEILERRFEIVEFVGPGGMGEVYEVLDRDLYVRRALKTIRADLIHDATMRKRFLREIEMAQQVSHRNVCRVFDQVRIRNADFDILCYTMEFIEGGTLADLLADEGRLPLEEALPIARQLAEGLTAIHETNPRHPVIHRDLKPGNVMIDRAAAPALRVVVTDFGLARSSNAGANLETQPTDLSAPGFLPGTPKYMAPEQLAGETIGPAADIYAFGLILYEMVTGADAFPVTDPVELGVRRKAGRPDLPKRHVPELPKRWQDVILWCLETDPARRPKTAAEAVRAIEDRRIRIPFSKDSTREHRVWRRERAKRWAKAMAAPATALALIAAALIHAPTRAAVQDRGCNWFPGSALFCALPADKDVAILPFENLSVEPEARALAAGLVNHASAGLSRLYPDKETMCVHVRSDELADGMKLALTGAVEALNDRVRVTAGLRTTGDGRLVRKLSRDFHLDDAEALHSGLLLDLAEMLEVEIPADRLGAWRSEGAGVASAMADYLRGVGYRETQEYETASSSFSRAADADLSFALAHAGMGDAYRLLYLDTGEAAWAEASQASFEFAEDITKELPQTFFGLGQLAIARKQPEEAIGLFEQALSFEPYDFDARRALASAYQAADRLDEAETANLLTANMRPGCWYVYNHLGIFYAYNGRFRDARQHLLEVVKLAHDNGRAYANLAYLYSSTGQFREAATRAQQAIDRGILAVGHNNLGRAQYFLGCYEESAANLERARQLDDSDPRFDLHLAETYMALGRRSEADLLVRRAVGRVKQLLVRKPGDQELLRHLTVGLARLGEKVGAIEAMKAAHEVAPKNPEILLFQAVAFELMNDRENSLPTLQAALEAGLSVEYAYAWPDLTELVTDPHFVETVRELGLHKELQAAKAAATSTPSCASAPNSDTKENSAART